MAYDLPRSSALGLPLTKRYLTAADLSTDVPDFGFVIRQLRQVPVEWALDWVARMLSPCGVDWDEHQRLQAVAWFKDVSGGRRARELVLSGERELLAPQMLLLLARLALRHSSVELVDPEMRPGEWEQAQATLGSVMLVLGQHVGAERRADDERLRRSNRPLLGDATLVTGLETEILANLIVNHRDHPPSALYRSERRWLEIPRERPDDEGWVDLEAAYEAGTGVPLSHLRLVASMLWATGESGTGPHKPPGHLDALGLGAAATGKVLDLLSGTVAELRDRELDTDAGMNTEYAFSLFGERPVVRLADGGLLVLEQGLLLERAFGWLPKWDMDMGLRTFGSGGKKRAARAVRYLQKTTERHALEGLAAAVAGRASAVYGESEIQLAFGTDGTKNADAVVDLPGAWVVVEVSSRPVKREAALAVSAADLLEEIDKGVVEKARQLDGTVDALRRDESRLTGTDAHRVRRFWPVLVATEGFPVHPVLTHRISALLRQESLLQGDDVEPLVVVDTAALECVEALAEQGGPGLLALLEEHAASDMRTYGFQDWLLVAHGPLQAPSRVRERWERALAPVLEALESEERRHAADAAE